MKFCGVLWQGPKRPLERTKSKVITHTFSVFSRFLDVGRLRSLTTLTLVNAGGLMASLLHQIPHPPRLHQLRVDGFREDWNMNLTSSLTSIRHLTLTDFPNSNPPTKSSFNLNRFDQLVGLPKWISKLSCLETLELWYCNKLKLVPQKDTTLQLFRLQLLHILDILFTKFQKEYY